jgi:DNA-directed RNA polymerase I subunit RPA49
VHNRRTQTTVFRPVPLHVLSQRVKALKGLEHAPVFAKERLEARAALGETFGTKKVRAAIQATERNKVDVKAMEGVMGYLVDRIEKNTETLPTEGACRHVASPSF